ncbi:MAG: hypothetical protein MJE68_21235 [Proteobacteria bacterium]|nr:hypothetical protein [Pseudomonadota bacterium]
MTLEKGVQLGTAKHYKPDVVVVNENTVIKGGCATVAATPANSSERYEQLQKALSLLKVMLIARR